MSRLYRRSARSLVEQRFRGWCLFAYLASGLLSGVAAAIPAEDFPLPAHSASYELLRAGAALGRLEISLERGEHAEWLYRSETVATSFMGRLLGLGATEYSRFRWVDGYIQPLQYRHEVMRPGRNRFWLHDYDWPRGSVSIRSHDGDLRVPLESAVLDPMSLRLAVSILLQEPGSRYSDHRFRVLERDELEDQWFRYLGRELLELPQGCFAAVHLQRFRREGSSRNYQSWHGEHFHWLPLRLLQFDDAGEADLELRLTSSSLPLVPGSCTEPAGRG